MKDNKPLENLHILASGMLDVGDGHHIYWIDWGNKDITNPIFYLHGGPGGGVDNRSFDNFNPKTQRVVFHDQRGSSRSTPFASIVNNQTSDLVDDINKLRKHLGIDKLSFYGFSWGATLALIYSIHNPTLVEKMLIGGIFLAREEDNDFYLGGATATHFPEAWEQFISIVDKNSPLSVAQYYKKMLFGDDEKLKKQFARAWMLYESNLVFLDYNPVKIERELDDWATESLAYLEAHYLLNSCFIEENYILKNAHKLSDIDIVIVQGRYDFVCTPAAARDLHEALGDKAILHMIMAGHDRSEVTAREVVKAYTNVLWR